jgi:pSer/pThr/pTyr-binding forkhead associated (FHA) protein
MSPEIVLLALRIALALVLYAFLGTTLLYLWRDLRSAGAQAELAPAGYLELLTDPSPGSTFPLASSNLLGRAADNTIQIDESTVSAHHARLSFQGGQWWLEDLGSKNGTGVNELDLEEPMVVTYGDHIRLGNLHFELKSGSVIPPALSDLALTAPLPEDSES